MKYAEQLVKMACVVGFTALILFSCKKSDTISEEPGSGPPVVPGKATSADTISNHLKLFNAVQKTGTIPTGGSASLLKISFEDTLFLFDEVKRPIKYLHEDSNKNVTGVYLQIFVGGSASSYYYDVPELSDVATNDTVSAILIGIDPDGLVEPAGVPPAASRPPIKIEIVPHGKNGEPLGRSSRDLVIKTISSEPSASVCGLVLPIGDFWKWDLTLIEDLKGTGLVFYNDHHKLWGELGQDIKGCCIDGKSTYDINCASNTNAQRSLRFKTNFRYVEELLKFFSDGTFARSTRENHVLPDPQLSDFCGAGPGVVHLSESFITFFGDYTVTKLSAPFFMGGTHSITMKTTKVAGGTGIGRSGGIIHQLDCNVLALIQPDREGGQRHEVSFFEHISTNGNNWFKL